MRAELEALIEAADEAEAVMTIVEPRSHKQDYLASLMSLRDALAAVRKALEEPDQLAAALAHDATSIGIADNLLQQLSEARADVAKVIRARDRYEQFWRQAEGNLVEALKERDEFKRMGQQFERDGRATFEQSCRNLQRAEAAKRERDEEFERANEWREQCSRNRERAESAESRLAAAEGDAVRGLKGGG